MMSSRVLDNQSLVAFNTLVLGGFLNSPFADICPLFIVLISGILLRVGRLPSLAPVIGKLLEEVGLDGSGL